MFVKNINNDLVGKTLNLKGWVSQMRSSGKIMFVEFRDGTGYIQLIIEKKNIGEESFESLKTSGIETSLEVVGEVSKHPKKEEFELQVSSVKIISETHDYPIGQKDLGVPFLLDNRHLWLRSKKQWAIQRIRNTIIYATYDWFRNNDFIKIDSPIFTPSACEGTTDLFAVDYVNGETVYLSQSGQLYLEAAIMAHGRAFDFGPVFRAEKSKTRRHLNEFWMMDAEMAYVTHSENMEIQEKLVYFILQEVLAKNKGDLEILERDTSKLEQIKLPFLRKTHQEIVKELQEMGSEIKDGEDLGGNDEQILMEKYTQPIFVEKYPLGVKAFYMKEDPQNPGYALCADLLAPEGYGEVIGGSEREGDYEALLKKIKEHNLNEEDFSWYLDIRKYGGVPHSGFGYGLERLVRWMCGIHHVRETIPFPRLLNRTTP